MMLVSESHSYNYSNVLAQVIDNANFCANNNHKYLLAEPQENIRLIGVIDLAISEFLC